MHWHIELLGGLRVQVDGKQADLGCQKPTALLAYLALQPQHRESREVLIVQLWPQEDDAERERQKLRQALLDLRKILKQKLGTDALLHANSTAVWLDATTLTTDVEEFEAAVQAVRSTTDHDTRLQCLHQAMERYQGKLFPGYYGDWILDQRDRLHETFCWIQQEGSLLKPLPLAKKAEPISETPYSLPRTEPSLVSSPFQPTVQQPSSPRQRAKFPPLASTLLIVVCLLVFLQGRDRPRFVNPSPPPSHATAATSDREALLQELERLESPANVNETATEAQERLKLHAKRCLELVEKADQNLHGPEEYFWRKCLHTRLCRHWEQALKHFLQARDAEQALTLSGALGTFWFQQDNTGKAESRHWIGKALQLAGTNNHELAWARAVCRYTRLAWALENERPRLKKQCQEAIEIFGRHNDPFGKAEALRMQGLLCAASEEFTNARKAYEAARRQLLEGSAPADSRGKLELALIGLAEAELSAQDDVSAFLSRQKKREYREVRLKAAKASLDLFLKIHSDYGVNRACEQLKAGLQDRHQFQYPIEVDQLCRDLLGIYRPQADEANRNYDRPREASIRKDCLQLAVWQKDPAVLAQELKDAAGFWRIHNWAGGNTQNACRLYGALMHLNESHTQNLLTPKERDDILRWGDFPPLKPKKKSTVPPEFLPAYQEGQRTPPHEIMKLWQ